MISNGTITLPCGTEAAPGTDVTFTCGSDRYPYLVLGWTKSGKTLWVQRQKATAAEDHEGVYGRQSYTIEPDAEGEIVVVTWRPSKGAYDRKGHATTRGIRFTVGSARCHQDPGF